MNGQKTVFALVAVVYNIKSALIRISIAQLFNSYLLHILRLVVRTEQPCVFIIELLGGGYLFIYSVWLFSELCYLRLLWDDNHPWINNKSGNSKNSQKLNKSWSFRLWIFFSSVLFFLKPSIAYSFFDYKTDLSISNTPITVMRRYLYSFLLYTNQKRVFKCF